MSRVIWGPKYSRGKKEEHSLELLYLSVVCGGKNRGWLLLLQLLLYVCSSRTNIIVFDFWTPAPSWHGLAIARLEADYRIPCHYFLDLYAFFLSSKAKGSLLLNWSTEVKKERAWLSGRTEGSARKHLAPIKRSLSRFDNWKDVSVSLPSFFDKKGILVSELHQELFQKLDQSPLQRFPWELDKYKSPTRNTHEVMSMGFNCVGYQLMSEEEKKKTHSQSN